MISGPDWLGLHGKVCVVTGAGGGIGAAIVRAFAEMGGRVALLDRDIAAAERAASALTGAPGQLLPLSCNVTDPENVQSTANAIRRSLGPCEVLVNNAGVLKPGSLASLPVDDWNAMLAINLSGYFVCAQIFAQHMLERNGGSMVHVASIAARQPQGFSGAYSVSKAGIVMLSRQLALELGPHGIRSNSVSPGLIRTPLTEKFYEQEDVAERRAAIVPAGRVGTPGDVADVVAFLASGRSAYVNGDDITVDGGFSLALMGQIPRPGYEANGPAATHEYLSGRR